ncbi:MAG: enoyl-CoA hydratase [Acidobacteria bacterium]|nr:MAG: enoyl-CoA hydratase [Acidobacteriota bacterium]
MAAAETVKVEDADGARWITLDRPPVNVLDLPTIAAIGAALTALESRRDIKVVVFRSAIAGTFSAGVEVRDHVRERVGAMLDAFHGVVRHLEALPQATVAAVDGTCLGGGCELASVCDIVLATPRSVLGQPEIDVGCFPPVASVLLPRLVGRAAAEIVLTGAPLSAAAAARIGLVSRVVDGLDAETRRVVALLAGKSAAVLALARRALREGASGTFSDALARVERLYRDELMATHDAEEGVRAFLEKRPPRWRDR